MVPPHGHRSPDELGRRGLALLERYDTDGDSAALAAGLALLAEAVAAAPGHPQRMRWWYGLGAAHESRADELGSVDDYDRAIGWYARIHAELPPNDPDRTFIALALTGAYWSRFWLMRYGGAGEPADCRTLVEELLASIARYPVGDWDAEAAAFVRMIQGLAWEERYQAGADPADLDRGIVLLAGAVPVLPDDTPWLAVAAFTLATAYWDSYGRTDVPRELNLAIAMDARAIELAADGDPTWLSAHEHQALCLAARWRRTGDRTDLDRAIASWRVALSRTDDGWPVAQCGELIRERAELDADPVAAAEAVRLLEFAAGTEPAYLLELGRGHRTQWTVGRVEGGLAAAERCFTEVVAAGPAGGAPVVDAALREMGQLAQSYHDRGVLALAADGDPTVGLADLAAAVRTSAAALAATGAEDPRRVPLLLVAVLARWSRYAYTGDVDGLPELNRMTAELVAAQPLSGELRDAAVLLRGALLAALVTRDPSAATPERTAELREARHTLGTLGGADRTVPDWVRHLFPIDRGFIAIDRLRDRLDELPMTIGELMAQAERAGT
jgi:tetratricopeptide (TPR) repeat protein